MKLKLSAIIAMAAVACLAAGLSSAGPGDSVYLKNAARHLVDRCTYTAAADPEAHC